MANDVSTRTTVHLEAKQHIRHIETPHAYRLTAQAALTNQLSPLSDPYNTSFRQLTMGFSLIFIRDQPITERRLKKLETEWASSPIDVLQTRLDFLSLKFKVSGNNSDALADLEACIRVGRKEFQETARSIMRSIAGREDLVLRIGHRDHHTLRATQDEIIDILSEVEPKGKVERILIPVVQMRRKLLGDANTDTLRSMSRLADQHLKHQEWAEAKSLLLAILDSKTSSGHMMKLAKVHAEQGHWDKAERLLARVLEGMKGDIEVDRRDRLYAMEELAKAYRGQRLWAEAEYQFRQVVAERTSQNDEDVETWVSMDSLGKLLVDLGNKKEGKRWLKAASERKERLRVDCSKTVKMIESQAQTLDSSDTTSFAKMPVGENIILDSPAQRAIGVVKDNTPEREEGKSHMSNTTKSQIAQARLGKHATKKERIVADVNHFRVEEAQQHVQRGEAFIGGAVHMNGQSAFNGASNVTVNGNLTITFQTVAPQPRFSARQHTT